jgi:hypothetical protein
LYEIASREAEGGTVAYDVRVLEACRDLGMRCWSVAPELMRHLGKESEIASVDLGEEDGIASEAVGREDTANIDCGVRSNDAFFAKDEERLEYLKDIVGRQGKCLRDWVTYWALQGV